MFERIIEAREEGAGKNENETRKTHHFEFPSYLHIHHDGRRTSVKMERQENLLTHTSTRTKMQKRNFTIFISFSIPFYFICVQFS